MAHRACGRLFLVLCHLFGVECHPSCLVAIVSGVSFLVEVIVGRDFRLVCPLGVSVVCALAADCVVLGTAVGAVHCSASGGDEGEYTLLRTSTFSFIVT